MTSNRRTRSSVALVAAVGTLVLGGAATALAADLAPGVEKDAVFRDGAFAQDVAPDGVDIVSAAMAAVRGAAGEPSSRFAGRQPDAISAAAALLGGAREPAAAAGAFAGEAGGFDRLRAVGYGGENGLMAAPERTRHHQHGDGRFADAAHPALAAIAAAVNRFGGEASFAGPDGVGAFDALGGLGSDGQFKTTRLPVNAEGYGALRDAAADTTDPAASGLMSDAAVAGAFEPAAIRAAAAGVDDGRIGFGAPTTAFAALIGSGDAAVAAEAGSGDGMAQRLRDAAVSVGTGDGAFSFAADATGVGAPAVEAMRALLGRVK